MTARVTASAVERSFTDRRGRIVTALAGVSLAIERGAFVGFSGPSGCGKTTLLSLLGGLDRPTAGRVELDGVDLGGASDAALSRARRGVGFVFQHAPVLRGLALWENVTYPLVPLGVPTVERRERAVALLRDVGLDDRIDERPEVLSGGERQRLGVARALVADPPLLIADEPTSQLDDAAARDVIALLRAAHDAGRTVLVATHDARLLAQAGAVHRMAAGRLVSAGAVGQEAQAG